MTPVANLYETNANMAGGAARLILEHLGDGKRVLELGCSTGYMSLAMAKQGCYVVGVDNDYEAVCAARDRGIKVLQCDLDQPELLGLLLGVEAPGAFGVIVAADVLEHLQRPDALLASLRGFLAPDGYLLASIPNVAHGSVRLALLAGTWPVADTGLLDRTHLRFFTARGIADLFAGAGWRVETTWRATLPIDMSEVPWPKDEGAYRALEHLLNRDPEALTYQYVVKAVPA